MLDIAVAYNKYRFLGNDFLTWIWFVIETGQNITLLIKSKEVIELEIGHSIVLENELGDKSKEKITIKGDFAGLEEGRTALQKGAWVTKINLVCKINDEKYRFTINGESFNITGLKTPATKNLKGDEDIEALVLEKIFLCTKIIEIIDSLFGKYIEKRIADDWRANELNKMRKWIKEHTD